MSKRPEMPFRYQGVDVEALGHLVSARVLEMLDGRLMELFEPLIRRCVWDAVSELMQEGTGVTPPRSKSRLSDETINDLGNGMHGDGGNLYLRVAGNGRSWVFRWTDRTTGKLRDMGIGSATTFSLTEARKRARDLRKLVADGKDPSTARIA